jgi:hypothetical protein
MDMWILARCRRVCLHKLIAWIAVGLAVCGVAFLYKNYLVDFFEGPYPKSETELSRILSPNAIEHNFVRVAGSKIVDTGLQQVEVSKGYGTETQKVKAGYYVLKTGQRLLLVKAASTPSLTVDGSLEPIPSDVWSHLFHDPAEQRELSPRFLHVLLNAESFRLPGYIGLSIGALALSFVSFFGYRVWKQLQDPSGLRVVQRVKGWGDQYTISSEIERECAQSVRMKQGSVRFTDKYAVLSRLFKFDVFRIEDLVWAYKGITRHYTNFIPTGKTYNAVLVFYGGALDIQGADKKINSVLEFLLAKAPWAIFGYSKERAEVFSKNTAGFCQVVEQRRRQAGR